jgi:hypothetical protein
VVAFKSNIEIRNIIGFEEFLGTVAIGTKLGCLHHDLWWVEGIIISHKSP